MNNQLECEEDVMLQFAVEPRHDPETINWYIKQYPSLSKKFEDLLKDLRLLGE